MEDKEYRYTELTGPADITRSGEIIRVTLQDPAVNPNGKQLRFDNPIDSDPDSSPDADGTIHRDDVKIVAGLNRAWFEYHTEIDGFRFKKEDGQVAEKWEDLDEPKRGEEMDPVKPDDPGLLSTGVKMDPVKPDPNNT